MAVTNECKSGVNFNKIVNTIGDAACKVELKLKEKIEATSNKEDPSTQDLVQLQVLTQRWTVITQLESNVIKTVGDLMKAVVQNIR